ncbi:hypothetical protein EV03_0624 [Prochlorococcus marinus str. PAC1]|uniref:Uncharacterized protein n=1 Tax=Prochlorococcus marinus str. PAC1 TaxID=59924 RepID=A0A0A2C8S1_PROMR|nr:hypothetical protein EV03_0624 [Prochlorococcus marinus str. PAC1]
MSLSFHSLSQIYINKIEKLNFKIKNTIKIITKFFLIVLITKKMWRGCPSSWDLKGSYRMVWEDLYRRNNIIP